MNTPEPLTIREPTAWLRTTAKHRARGLARTARRAAQRHPGATIVAALARGPQVTPGSREDRTCDRCRTYVPTNQPFGVCGYPVQVDDITVLLSVGLCEPHMRAEIPDFDELNVPTLDAITPVNYGSTPR